MVLSPSRPRRSRRALRTEIEFRSYTSERIARRVIERSPVGAFAALLVEWKLAQDMRVTQEDETSRSA
jgi:hypothetical protein